VDIRKPTENSHFGISGIRLREVKGATFVAEGSRNSESRNSKKRNTQLRFRGNPQKEGDFGISATGR
jgi:hypothetical protein